MSSSLHGRALWTGECSVRLSGHWPARQVRQLSFGPRRAVLFGECLAPDTALLEHLASAPTLPRAVMGMGSLAGAYGVVVTDGSETAIAGDMAGLVRIWFRCGEGTVEYASSPLPLASPDGLRINPGILAARMLCPDVIEGSGGASLFSGLTELPPDQVLHARVGHASVVERSRHWERTDFATASDALHSALLTGVDERVAGVRSVTADLSGGLDSSSLALLAARGRTSPIPALTYTDSYAANDDDTDYASRIAAVAPALEQVLVEGDAATLPFTDMMAVPFTDHPSLDTVIYARDRSRLLPAQGSTLHLVGDGGDVVLGAPLTYLADLARPARARQFVRETTGWARLRHRPVHRVIRAALTTARTSYTDTLTALASQLEGLPRPHRAGYSPAMENSIAWAALSQSAPWATPSARSAAAGLLRQTAEGATAADGADAHTLRTIRWHAAATRSFMAIAEHLDVRVSAPFFDHQVLDACLSLPAADRVSADRAKPLLGAAMVGLLPNELFTRRTKGDYSACEYHGARRNAAVLRALLHESRLDDLGIIRPDLVLRELDTAVGGGRAAMAGLGEVLSAEVWLRRLDDRSSPVTTANQRQGHR
nr:albusnodin/ikarugamycin family macrolactam cyclase [Allosalinactinospora lopnorensis]